MNCNFGPYQITTELEAMGENMFIDNSKSKQVVIFGNCNSIIPPCVDAVVLKRQDDCPQCDVVWFDCPSTMGRTYTILATPCGVTISSFNDGLISLQGCDATAFGSGHFCFGYIYSSVGKFKSNDESAVSFVFDGHKFLVRGNIGICSDDMFVCGECQPASVVTAFAELPAPPSDPSGPLIDDAEEEVGVDDVPKTEVVPAEGRSFWSKTSEMTEAENLFDDTFCEDEREINTGVTPTDWPGGTALTECESNDNPSVATLPSGHTIIAYEHRREDGLTKINLAILKSSVQGNVRYHRSLSRGVLLNTLASSSPQFEVFDEMLISSFLGLTIGFLTGPLKGTTKPVRSVTRSVDGSRIKHLFTFDLVGQPLEFPDKNNIHDIAWFLLDSTTAPDLPPSDSEVTTVLELPDHKDAAGTVIPVAHPSIAVAKNNLMTVPEQNIYVTYQAFENNEWRVYLREILLGTDAESSPAYVAPYLFDDDSQRQIEIMQTTETFSHLTGSLSLGSRYWKEIFAVETAETRLGQAHGDPAFTAKRWFEEQDLQSTDNQIRKWKVWDELTSEIVTVENAPIYMCNFRTLPSGLLPTCGFGTTCVGSFTSRLPRDPDEPEDLGPCWIGDTVDDDSISFYRKAFAIKNTNTIRVDNAEISRPIPHDKDFAITMGFAIGARGGVGSTAGITVDRDDENNFILPEVWFVFGRHVRSEWGAGWRIQILRGDDDQPIRPSAGVSHDQLGKPLSQRFRNCSQQSNCPFPRQACFIFRLYDGYNRDSIDGMTNGVDLNISDGTENDVPLREIWKCVNDPHGANDYVILGLNAPEFNEWRVETYRRGKKRIFDIYLANAITPDVLMASFQEWDPEQIADFIPLSTSHATFGPYHGFGFYHANNRQQIIIDEIRADELLEPTKGPNGNVFYEDDMTSDGNWIPRLRNPAHKFNTFHYFLSNPPVNAANYAGWAYLPDMHFDDRNDAFRADAFYDGDIVKPAPHSSHARIFRDLGFLDQPGQGPPSWTYTVIDAAASNMDGAEEINNVSMILSVARDRSLGSWPHVWFVLRLQAATSEWFSGYRVRISRFTAPSSGYASASVNHGGTRPAIGANEEYWRLQLFAPSVGHAGTETDLIDDEVYIKIVTTTPGAGETNIDWISGGSAGLLGNPQSKVWPYFKVEITIESGPVLSFKIYVGEDDTSEESGRTFDEVIYELLHTFTSTIVEQGTAHPYYGFALFDGNNTDHGTGEPELDNDDHPALGRVNYIKLEELPETVFPTGVCCLAEGGCQPSVLEADCRGDDKWAEGETCGAFDCTTLIPVGAACGYSGGDFVGCIDNVTEAEALLQGFGSCPPDLGVNCSWIEDSTCDDRGCPEPTELGSCCRPDTTVSCIDNITREDCTVFFGESVPGQRWRSNTTCAEVLCPDIDDGACCKPGIGCEILTLEQCGSISGATFIGLHTDCGDTGDNVCVGACCDIADACTDVDEQTCIDAGSTFHGHGTACATVNCVIPNEIAACCHLTGGTCSDTEASVCDGVWHTGESCTDVPSPCPVAAPTGACCHNGECTSGLTAVACADILGSEWRGAGSSCNSADCDLVTGACCFSADDCRNDFTSSGCANAGGTWQGGNIQCINNLCSPILLDNPYVATDITFKPEDLWRIEIDDEKFVTRVLYHMREKITASSSLLTAGANSQIDFIFVIDHSQSMKAAVNKVQQAFTVLSESFLSKGFDARFGFVVFSRTANVKPVPKDSVQCATRNEVEYIFNGLQYSRNCRDENPRDLNAGLPFDTGTFTRNVDVIQKALDCWGSGFGEAAPWSAIRFALTDEDELGTSLGFDWRSNSEKFMIFVSDTNDEIGEFTCNDILNKKSLAKADLASKKVKFIPIISVGFNSNPPRQDDTSFYEDVAVDSGWEGGVFDVNSASYASIFESIETQINTIMRTDHATVIERATPGVDNTYLKKAEVIITYDGDLSDLWSFNKSDFEFQDDHVPFDGTNTKGLVNFPFDLSTEQIYGIESVHTQGIQANWVSFGAEGPLNYAQALGGGSGVGFRASGSGDPILVSTNSSRPKVFVNNRNQVIVAYENYDSGTPNIELKGTGDFHQDSITGPKASRIQRFLTPSDFAYSHAITLPTTTIETSTVDDPYSAPTVVTEGTINTTGTSEGLSQLCDFVVDNSDITHIVWQSNASGYWEVYYANSSNTFIPVRVTESKSRSSHPSISVDETGSIFVVYHDDRFGPFNIMLASKDEERIIPLIEQDAYLASLKEKYTHYTNTLPAILDNPSGETPQLGQFWASKVTDGAGNDEENAIYKLDETSGVPGTGTTSAADKLNNYLAFSSNALYSINLDGTLYKIANITDTKEVSFLEEQTVLGTIEKDITDFQDARILDMTVDRFDRIWVLIFETMEGDGPGFATTPSELPLVRAFGVNDRLRLIQASSVDAATLSTGIVFDGEVGSDTGSAGTGSITVTSDNQFHITFEQEGGDNVLASADYPQINQSTDTATFDFTIIGTFSIGLAVAMTHDVSNTLWVVTAGNDLYTLNSSTAAATFQISLTAESGAEVALPVGTTSGIAFQDLDVTLVGSEEIFHVRLDFYDNIAFEGEPFLVIDSRENLEAFINTQTLNDPYAEMSAGGILIGLDQTGILFFDATHFVPGFSNLSHPYTFEPNQTYFARVFVIPPNGHPRESGVEQNNSFSCSKCSRFGNNNFNASSCSYSFVSRNESDNDLFFNYQIDFYADSGKQHIIRRFEAKPGSPDLAYMEVDNRPATSLWTDNGLPIVAGGASFIQIHPVLDPQAGFLCGVQYTVHVNQCLSPDSECLNYVAIVAGKWSDELVGDPFQNINTNLNPDDLIPGLSMSTIGDDIIMAWIDTDDKLMYGRFDGESWDIQTVPVQRIAFRVIYCSISLVNGLPSILYVTLINSGNNHFSEVLTLNDGQWAQYPFSNILSSLAKTPRSLIDLNGIPLFVFPLRTEPNGGAMQFIAAEDGGFTQFDFDTGYCGGGQGGCVISITLVDGNPVIAAVARNSVVFSRWGGVQFGQPTFGTIEVIGNPDSPVLGKIGVADINGQPAVAYLRNEGDKQRLIYRQFNGTNWKPFDTLSGLKTYGKHVALASIDNQPAIAYSIPTGPSTSQLWVAFFNGVFFVNDLVDPEINVVDPLLDMVQFRDKIALVASANPFKIYFFRQFAASSDSELHPVFMCECSSKIFTNSLTHLHEVARWESSAHGFADTRVTDSVEDSLRPVIQTRPSGAAIILWEDKNITDHCDSPPCVRAATFRNANQDQLRGSGTGWWFDYDFGISGQDVSLALDLYDRVNAVYETAVDSNAFGFHGKGESKEELPRNKLKAKVCDFVERATSSTPGGTITPVISDIAKLEKNVISFDKFISEQIVRKIVVKDEFVSYQTYNVSGVLTPIVSTCNIVLEIHGTPEIVAIRLRGEDNAAFSPWGAWSPQIGDFVMEKAYKLSGKSGIKEVCIQAITYDGITTEFCLPIVADYESVIFETKFYSNLDNTGTDVTTQFITPDTGGVFPSDLDAKLVVLPLSQGISVANLAPIPAATVRENVQVLVEIIPNQVFEDEDDIVFDVIQQGSNDVFGEKAKIGKNNEGRVVYRGHFAINREDKVSNIDGLARINPNFPNSCEESGGSSTSTGSGPEISGTFARDKFNIFGQQTTVEDADPSDITDALADFRQPVSGRIGVTVDIRPDEDPYFIFGDPNYAFTTTEGRRIGVPFEVTQTEIAVGEFVEQEDNFCPPKKCPEGESWLPRKGLNDGCCCTPNGTDERDNLFELGECPPPTG